ncbi:hypothetical protein niasHS_005697 [Heterodera schachtii]|uniref:Eukaryotic translation initiation factor 3 subunit C N-terminal domain-containing protein n=1 Tax=Heterodera schachtii TaxID=97005 RepID=A0ABD2JZD3_HETSC
MLCQIYHQALHDRWHKAKNLLLMSHLQALMEFGRQYSNFVQSHNLPTRTLCFSSWIQNTQRAKDLLAQGILDGVRLFHLLNDARNPKHRLLRVRRASTASPPFLPLPTEILRESGLIGPPENKHVVVASRAMLRSEWIKCRNYIIFNDKMNAR